MHKVVLFDLDGTLVDSLQLTFDGCNHALKQVGLGPFTPEQVLKYFGPGEREILAKMADAHLGQADPKRNQSIFEAYLDYWQTHTHRVKIHEGVPALITELKRQHFRMGLVTGRGRDTTQSLVALLEKPFEIVITGDDVTEAKPSPQGIHLALEQLKIAPSLWSQIAYVGDSAMDLQAAKRAGLKPIGAKWDRHAKIPSLQAENPAALLDSPDQLLAHL